MSAYDQHHQQPYDQHHQQPYTQQPSAQPYTQQPSAQPPMSTKPEKTTDDLAKKAAEAAAKEAAKKTVDYAADHADPQKMQDDVANAKAQAQGMFAKYCGCLGSVM